jgi:hypothetical protein
MMRKLVISVPEELSHCTPEELTQILVGQIPSQAEGFRFMTYGALKDESARLTAERPPGYEAQLAQINLYLRRWGRV